jgi:FlaA1/EpsC-like NDP-sugar epimerase
MQRLAVRSTQVLIDLTVLAAAFALAFVARFDGDIPAPAFRQMVLLLPYVIAFQYGMLVLFGVTSFAWRYLSLREVGRIGLALGAAALVLLAGRLLAPSLGPAWVHAKHAAIPIGVNLINFTLGFLGIAGVRGARRMLAERSSRSGLSANHRAAQRRTLLIGAGEAGALVAREIANRPDLGICPIGFLDDDRTKHGLEIHGVKVIGSIDDLPGVAQKLNAQQGLISMASAPGETIRRIMRLCEAVDLPVKIIPGIFEILDGRVNLSRIRSVSIGDLLGRPPVQLDVPELEAFIRGKRVLVTGAGGSIGSELCRQIAGFGPASLTLVERAEFHLFTIHQELIKRFPALPVRPRICDVCDSRRLDAVFAEDCPEVVFHAAAHKHVPMMEWNPGEALKNNVFGTRKVADAADKYGTSTFVLISTDKAVNPTSIMGATKRVAEMYVQALSRRSKTKYLAVRFGNVLGSAGSVIPIFQQQIAAGGPVTVTHPDMKRYFMTIPEACQLVIQAGAMGRGGEIFVLDMGTPMRIVDLARDLIRLSGFEPDVDIRIEYTGVRPGEKLFEELGFDAEKMDKTRHDKIFVGRLSPCDYQKVEQDLVMLSRFTACQSSEEVRAALQQVVPEMQPDATTNPPPVRHVSVQPAPTPAPVLAS